MANLSANNKKDERAFASQVLTLAQQFIQENFDISILYRKLIDTKKRSALNPLRYTSKLVGPHYCWTFLLERNQKTGDRQGSLEYDERSRFLELWVPSHKTSCTLTREQGHALSKLFNDCHVEQERRNKERSLKKTREKMSLPRESNGSLPRLSIPAAQGLNTMAHVEKTTGVVTTSQALQFGLPLQQAFTEATGCFVEWSVQSLDNLGTIERRMSELIHSVLPDPQAPETTVFENPASLVEMTETLGKALDALIRDQTTACSGLEEAVKRFTLCEEIFQTLSESAHQHAQNAPEDHRHFVTDLEERSHSLGISATTAKMYAVLASRALDPVKTAFHMATQIHHETLPRLSALALATATEQKRLVLDRLREQRNTLALPATVATAAILKDHPSETARHLALQAGLLVNQTRNIEALTRTFGDAFEQGIVGPQTQATLVIESQKAPYCTSP